MGKEISTLQRKLETLKTKHQKIKEEFSALGNDYLLRVNIISRQDT